MVQAGWSVAHEYLEELIQLIIEHTITQAVGKVEGAQALVNSNLREEHERGGEGEGKIW